MLGLITKHFKYWRIFTNLTLTLKQICKEITENQSGADKWIERWDDVAEVPYMYKGENWISYDNEKSIASKVRHKYLKHGIKSNYKLIRIFHSYF